MGKINIEKMLCPESNVLITTDETFTAQILDAELDVLELTFNYDDCVEINTDGLTYITLTKQNLKTLKRLINEAEQKYDEHYSDPKNK